MALSNKLSSGVALAFALGLFAAMQLYRHQLASTGPLTILGGGLGSILFMLILTAVGNLELILFGRGYQTSLLEVLFCLSLALAAAGRVHGVCFTTCFIFSLVTIYYMQRISQKVHGHHGTHSAHPVTTAAASGHKKKNK